MTNKLILFIALFTISQIAQACVLTMGYRTSARLPNIQAENNSGLYYDLYHKAATDIGCQLKVIRLPKKRVLRAIENGSIDFYPGLTFTPERAKFVLFVPNGLPSLDIGLTRTGVNEIKTPEDFTGKILLSTLGSTKLPRTEHALAVKFPPELSHASAVEYVLNGKVDIYVDELSTIAYQLKEHPKKDRLMYHLDCCGGLTELTLGFSRKSVHYKEVNNEDYSADKKLSFDNFPKKLEQSSVAHQFYQSLMKLKNNGYTEKIYAEYFGFDMSIIKATMLKDNDSLTLR
ncbi:transporter substrate-binding domain-containing protein [Colwellia asteriadis]|uniref:Transporter substrate-binding domain-containing protein n=1 Tax=Colwellia asteriadis TaxID=517723 RepID=A0ABP3WKG4_9GAMM